MLPRPLLGPALLALVLVACHGSGGSEEMGESGPATFTVTGRSPMAGSAGIPVTASIEVTFSGNIDESSVGPDAVALNGVTFGEAEVDGAKLRFYPPGDLLPGTSYAVTLDPDLRGTSGHLLGIVPAWGFKTEGALPPDTLPISGPRPR